MVKLSFFLWITVVFFSCRSLAPKPKIYTEKNISLTNVLEIELSGKCESWQVDLSQFLFNISNANDVIIEEYLKLLQEDTILFSHYISPRGSLMYIQNSRISNVLLLNLNDSFKTIETVSIRNNFIYRTKENICKSSDNISEPYIIQTMIYRVKGKVFFLNNWTDNFDFFQFAPPRR